MNDERDDESSRQGRRPAARGTRNGGDPETAPPAATACWSARRRCSSAVNVAADESGTGVAHQQAQLAVLAAWRGSRAARRRPSARCRGGWRFRRAAAAAGSAPTRRACPARCRMRTSRRSPNRVRSISRYFWRKSISSLSVTCCVPMRSSDRRSRSLRRREHRVGGLGVAVHQRRDRVQRVEQEVRMQLALQRLQPRLGETRAEHAPRRRAAPGTRDRSRGRG